MAVSTAAALPYEEPGVNLVLVQASFLLLLNIVNYVLDNLIYCGLLGQVLVGVAFGTPGARWLSDGVEHVVVQIGYLGLILLVYEGGLSTSFSSVKANALLSIAVAMTGIIVPIVLSFAWRMNGLATPLQAFVAGAALCSTSLGTTFTVIGTSGLTTTRLGTVLTSAAMMDDVVGLIMVQVISNLGVSDTNFDSLVVVRPVVVSIGLVIALVVVCRYVVRPVGKYLYSRRQQRPLGTFYRITSYKQFPLVFHTGILLGLVTGATYAGTSGLFAAYLAGVLVSWWDSEVARVSLSDGQRENVPEEVVEDKGKQEAIQQADAMSDSGQCGPLKSREASAPANHPIPESSTDDQVSTATLSPDSVSGITIYNDFFREAVERILKPFFFASIGFSIPITQMFTGPVVWRGIVYAILMAFGKLVTGLWLVRISVSLPSIPSLFKLSRSIPSQRQEPMQNGHISRRKQEPTDPTSVTSKQMQDPMLAFPSQSASSLNANGERPCNEVRSRSARPSFPAKPKSLYPSAILGAAMTARGEIGFLIASVAESTGIFKDTNRSDSSAETSSIYLIVVWAIVLCTILGPVNVGILVKRVRRLQAQRRDQGEHWDPLGVWGVSGG